MRACARAWGWIDQMLWRRPPSENSKGASLLCAHARVCAWACRCRCYTYTYGGGLLARIMRRPPFCAHMRVCMGTYLAQTLILIKRFWEAVNNFLCQASHRHSPTCADFQWRWGRSWLQAATTFQSWRRGLGRWTTPVRTLLQRRERGGRHKECPNGLGR